MEQRQIKEREKKFVVSKSRKIAPVASFGQINNIGSHRLGKFKKEYSWEQRQINKCRRAHAKNVAESELRKIGQVVSLGQINNVRTDRA